MQVFHLSLIAFEIILWQTGHFKHNKINLGTKCISHKRFAFLLSCKTVQDKSWRMLIYSFLFIRKKTNMANPARLAPLRFQGASCYLHPFIHVPVSYPSIQNLYVFVSPLHPFHFLGLLTSACSCYKKARGNCPRRRNETQRQFSKAHFSLYRRHK